MAILKTLIVDDEPGIRTGISRILKNYKAVFPYIGEDFTYELSIAEDGNEAMKKIAEDNFDLILLDNKLPGIEGIEILHHIKKNKLNCVVMMITSYASLDLAVKATKEGAYNFLPKPFTPDELRAAIENATKHLYLKRLTKNTDSKEKQVRFQFLSVIGHELKSPINAVESYLRIMQEKQVGDKIENYTKMIERSLERISGMRTLISDMLDLTRVETQNGTEFKNNCHINLIVNSVIKTLEPLAEKKGIKIIKNLPADLEFMCNENEMQIILNNLISNAIKYNIDKGKVIIGIEKTEHEISISVEDTGIGMSAQELDMLFKEFVRIKNKQTQHIEGSGLGLSIVKKITDKYNGKILSESCVNKGSKFTVILPL